MYEAGQLNLLCVLELTNHALQLLRDERRLLSDAPRPHLNPAHLQEKRQQMARVLQNLHLIRYALSPTSGAFHLLLVLIIYALLTGRRFLRKGFLRSGVPSESWRPSGTGSGWIP